MPFLLYSVADAVFDKHYVHHTKFVMLLQLQFYTCIVPLLLYSVADAVAALIMPAVF